jgi:E3 ubiquitin-protein ligase RNF1/2
LGEYEDDYDEEEESSVGEYGSDFEAGVEELEGAESSRAHHDHHHHPEDDYGLHQEIGHHDNNNDTVNAEHFHSADEEIQTADDEHGDEKEQEEVALQGTTATVWHPTSKYQEPLYQDMSHRPPWWPVLSLYELHRKPRQVVKGRWQCQSSMHQVLDAFRCIICWSTMKKPKAVRECMHRFCDECITTALRMGKNECPFCRVFVPSKRNLAVDESLEILIDNVLGPDLRTLESTELEDDTNDNTTDRDGGDDNEEEEEGISSSVHMRKAKRILNYAERPHKRRNADESTKAAAFSSFSDQKVESEEGSEEDDDDEEEEEEEEDSSPPYLVEFTLAPVLNEKRLTPLDRPYIRISGDATIGTLIKFLQAKLAFSGEIQLVQTSSARHPIPSKTPLSMIGALSQKLFYRVCPRPYKSRGSTGSSSSTSRKRPASVVMEPSQQHEEQRKRPSSVTGITPASAAAYAALYNQQRKPPPSVTGITPAAATYAALFNQQQRAAARHLPPPPTVAGTTATPDAGTDGGDTYVIPHGHSHPAAATARSPYG